MLFREKKKILFILAFVSMLFFYIDKVEAATENTATIKNRFAGSIVLEDRYFDKLYWYIDPVSQERYLLKNGDTLSRLLKNLSTGISDKDLAKLPNSDNNDAIDWEMTQKLKGSFLLQVENNGQIWYLNPLDQKIYSIDNGKNGLETLKNLALKLDEEKLSLFTINENLKVKTPDAPAIDFSIYWNVWDRLKMDHFNADSLSDVDRFYGSLTGMAEAMDDPYTQFFTPEGNQYFQENLEGSIEGIGAMVDIVDGIFTIVSPLENSPAQISGIKAKDQVLSVDGKNIFGFSLEKSISLIRGPKDTIVELEVFRPDTKETFVVPIKRNQIEIPYVESEILDKDIAYIKINMFSENMIAEFNKAKEATINENTRGVIIDLRNNPGGYTTVVRKLSDYWLAPGDKIYSEKYSDSTYMYTAYSEAEIKLPTVILINSGTASAAEIFTAALSEHDLAQTVGETSFGKGTGQSLENFSDGSALKYTVFEWLTPLNNSVGEIGLEPDFVVSNYEKNDLQLLKAKSLLK